jgi:hypothetical protein
VYLRCNYCSPDVRDVFLGLVLLLLYASVFSEKQVCRYVPSSTTDNNLFKYFVFYYCKEIQRSLTENPRITIIALFGSQRTNIYGDSVTQYENLDEGRTVKWIM